MKKGNQTDEVPYIPFILTRAVQAVDFQAA